MDSSHLEKGGEDAEAGTEIEDGRRETLTDIYG
jgi:hypothetical protein